MSAERNRAGNGLSIPAVAMIQVVHNRKIAANLSLLQIPLWWKLRRRQRSGRLERLLNRGATQIVLWVCYPSVFVGFAERILDIYSVQSSLPVKLARLRVYELEKLILVVYAVDDYGRGIPLVPFRFYRFGGWPSVGKPESRWFWKSCARSST
jgi:hypothetical protein